MNKRYLGMATAIALAFAAGPALADGELHIYNWGDYTNPKLIEKFQKETGIKVTLDDYDSNETMLAKVRADQADLVVRSLAELIGMIELAASNFPSPLGEG